MTALLLHIMPSHLCLVQTIVPGNITSLSFSVAPHNEPISLYTSGSGLFSAFCKTRGQSKWSTIDLDHGWLCSCLHSLIYTWAGLAEFVKVGKPRKQSKDFNKFGTELVYLIFSQISFIHKKGFHYFIYLLHNIYLNVVAKRLKIYPKIYLEWSRFNLIIIDARRKFRSKTAWSDVTHRFKPSLAVLLSSAQEKGRNKT